MYDNYEILIVVAAGNNGRWDKSGYLGMPATGKNIVAVGAHQLRRYGLGEDYIAKFSSGGPTSDGRMKPNLMAPGNLVLSAGA